MLSGERFSPPLSAKDARDAFVIDDGMTFFTAIREMHPNHMDRLRYKHQYNAFSSWMYLDISKQIIVYVSDASSCNHIMTDFPSFICIFDDMCQHLTENKTQINCIWQNAHEIALYDTMVYINGDIILMDDFRKTMYTLLKTRNNFVAIGQRTDLQVSPKDIDFRKNWQAELQNDVQKHGIRHGPYGIDYWVYSRSTFESSKIQFLNYLAGVFRWDNELLAEFMKAGIDVIDCTESIVAVHQNDQLNGKSHRDRDGAGFNELLSQNSGYMYQLGNLENADLYLKGHCYSRNSCVIFKNRRKDDSTIFMHRQRNIQGFAFAVVVASFNLEHSMNWIDAALSNNYNFFIIPLDQKAMMKLSSMKIEMFLHNPTLPKQINSIALRTPGMRTAHMVLSKLLFSAMSIHSDIFLVFPNHLISFSPKDFLGASLTEGKDILIFSTASNVKDIQSMYFRYSPKVKTFIANVNTCSRHDLDKAEVVNTLKSTDLWYDCFISNWRDVTIQFLPLAFLGIY